MCYHSYLNRCYYTKSNNLNDVAKNTFNTSVKYIPKSEQTREIKQNTINNKSTPEKEDKNISHNNKKFLNNVAAQGFAILK